FGNEHGWEKIVLLTQVFLAHQNNFPHLAMSTVGSILQQKGCSGIQLQRTYPAATASLVS
ncbi:MAG TPA: hypothetical protein PLC88_10705, partial [Syntrophomonas sp.]|nr:hypothetical protein [Syntrophomonas sp.]